MDVSIFSLGFIGYDHAKWILVIVQSNDKLETWVLCKQYIKYYSLNYMVILILMYMILPQMAKVLSNISHGVTALAGDNPNEGQGSLEHGVHKED